MRFLATRRAALASTRVTCLQSRVDARRLIASRYGSWSISPRRVSVPPRARPWMDFAVPGGLSLVMPARLERLESLALDEIGGIDRGGHVDVAHGSRAPTYTRSSFMRTPSGVRRWAFSIVRFMRSSTSASTPRMATSSRSSTTTLVPTSAWTKQSRVRSAKGTRCFRGCPPDAMAGVDGDTTRVRLVVDPPTRRPMATEAKPETIEPRKSLFRRTRTRRDVAEKRARGGGRTARREAYLARDERRDDGPGDGQVRPAPPPPRTRRHIPRVVSPTRVLAPPLTFSLLDAATPGPRRSARRARRTSAASRARPSRLASASFSPRPPRIAPPNRRHSSTRTPPS